MLLVLSFLCSFVIQDLADELEVSTRMIRIYKQELEQAGIYIQGKQGINGGYILDNMKSTIDIGLTGEEIYQLKNMKKNELDEAIINKIIKAYIVCILPSSRIFTIFNIFATLLINYSLILVFKHIFPIIFFTI